MFVKTKVIINQTVREYSKKPSLSDNIYILSAVRTPVGLLNGALRDFSAPQLGSFALREALQRAIVPFDELQKVFLGCVLNDNCGDEVIKRTGLPRTANVSSFPLSGMKSFIEAIKYLHSDGPNVCVAGGTVSLTNLQVTTSQKFFNDVKTNQQNAKTKITNFLLSSDEMNKFVKQDILNFVEAKKKGVFYDEIISIDFIRKGRHIMVSEDEIFSNQDVTKNYSMGNFNLRDSPTPGDGAVALVLSNEKYVRDNELTPLAKIVSYTEAENEMDLLSVQLETIEMALNKAQLQCSDIQRWEIDYVFKELLLNCINHFNIDCSIVNQDGSLFGLGYPMGMSGGRAICRLIHSLFAEELGCASTCDFNGVASAVILKKMNFETGLKPRLTLFTKKSCVLCDELKKQLRPFREKFLLHEIDIEAEENKRYQKLYAYEIPVLFLNGIFLCKHKLDVQHFSHRLSQFGS